MSFHHGGHGARGRGGVLFWLLVVVSLVFSAAAVRAARNTTMAKEPVIVGKWARFEQVIHSPVTYLDPLHEVELSAVFTSPLGETTKVNGFWDGGNVFRIRFCPDQPGKWTFKTSCSDPKNSGLNNLSGEFLCTSAGVRTRFDAHGPVRLARDRRHLEHLDRTPFFWLGDMAWGGGLLAKPAEWEFYAQTRARQDFTVAEWAAAPGSTWQGRSAWAGSGRITIDPEYFKQLDARVEALNRAGLLSAIVPLREVASQRNLVLPEDQAILLLKHMVARWGANDVAWVLSCDGDAMGGNVSRWKRIGRAVFGDGPHAPVVIDPGETYWVLEDFRRESWVDLFGYESGRAVTEDSIQWMVAGPISRDWMREPYRPIINLVPPIENDLPVQSAKRNSALEVRRAAYWSLLNSPAAGVNYGGHGVWNWIGEGTFNTKTLNYNALPVWQRALFMPGAKQMGAVGTAFEGIDFWQLRPAPELVVNQPGALSPARHISAARTENGDMALVYVPQDRSVDLVTDELPSSPTAVWINARSGERGSARVVTRGRVSEFATPGEGDWLLWLSGGAAERQGPSFAGAPAGSASLQR